MSRRSLLQRLICGHHRQPYNWHLISSPEPVANISASRSSISQFDQLLPRSTMQPASSFPRRTLHLPGGQGPASMLTPTAESLPTSRLLQSKLLHRRLTSGSLRSPLRVAGVTNSTPGVREAQQQTSKSDPLLQSAASMRFGQGQSMSQPVPSTSASPQASLVGTIQRITYSSEDTGYTVAKLKVSSSHGFSIPPSKGRPGLVTVTGKFPAMAAGQQWTCQGTWTRHKAYGQQLVVDHAEELRPASSDNLVTYLCGGATKGVGPVTARNMVDAYDDAILDVLDSEDAVKKLTKVKGIGAKTAAKIKDEWEKRRGDRGVREFLQQHGVTGVTAQRLLDQYGSLTEETVRQDPYSALTKTCQGSSFREAEKLARALGSPPDLSGRAGSAMLHSLAQAANSNGHSYLLWDQLQKEAIKLMSSSGRPWAGASLQEVAEDMFNRGDLLVEAVDSVPGDACHPKPDWAAPLRCYSPSMFNNEVVVARKLAQLAARGPLPLPSLPNARGITDWIESHERRTAGNGNTVKLSEGQRAAITAAATSPVCVLTGGPGCGKTTTTKYIVDLWSTMKKKVALCAPTGRAAQKLTETSGRQATTIHRLLQWVPNRMNDKRSSESTSQDASDTGGRFRFNARNHLALAEEGVDEEDWEQVDAVLVDEASMLGLPLASALLEALPPKCQLVFIGDVDQLPPVGPGKVLSDAIQSAVIPGVDLREIFRQAQQSNIVRTAHAVNDGDYNAATSSLPSLNASMLQEGRYRQGLTTDAAMLLAHGDNIGSGIQAVLTHLVQPQAKWDISRDVQVMSPFRKGSAGIHQLNASLQALLNPPAPNKPELRLSPAALPDFAGSAAGAATLRVGDRVIQTTNNYQKDIFNGDIGFVVDIKKAEREVVIRYPVVERQVVYRGGELGELQLAWASTVHKAQGSECPVVILALSPMHRPLLTRRLLYTALTRAKQLVVVVGSWDAVKIAVTSQRSEQRLSTLRQRITSLGLKYGATADKQMVTYTSQPAAAPARAEQRPEPVTQQRQQPSTAANRQQPAGPSRNSNRRMHRQGPRLAGGYPRHMQRQQSV